MTTIKKISIVVPAYNEEDNILLFYNRVIPVLNELDLCYEIIFINDGSTDNTLHILKQLCHKYQFLKVVDLSRNFGKDLALTAGIDYAEGDAVIPIDVDLQDPPELILELVSKWREGYDVVSAVRVNRYGETFFKKFTAHIFYKFMGAISEVQIPKNTGDFRLLDRRVVDALKNLPERTRFMKGLFAWVGFRQTYIYFDRQKRAGGQSKFNYLKLFNFAMDGITSFSIAPLKIWIYIGSILSSVSFIYAIYLVIRTVMFGIDVPGYASIMVIMLFLGGVQLFTMGILGEYIGRIFQEVKGRPIYIVKDIYASTQVD